MIIEGSNGTLRLNGNGELFERKFGSNKEFKINYKWDKKGFAGDSVFKCKSHYCTSLRASVAALLFCLSCFLTV